MQLGMVGLGRMGANMARRLLRHGHEVIAYDRDPQAVQGVVSDGVRAASSAADLAALLAPPRVIWLMVPDRVVDEALAMLVPHLARGDTVVDGGNSQYEADVRRAAQLEGHGLEFVDVGTSGGVWGLERGYCLMIGGREDVCRRLTPLFDALAPGVDAAPRTAAGADIRTAEQGYLYCGPHGAGHFVKMVHNAIEYGVMQAYAEGFNVMKHGPYDLNLPEVSEVWRRGSVVGSWLLDLIAAALARDPRLEGFEGKVGDSGEGRWALHTAIDRAVPVPVIAAALFARFTSRGEDEFANRLLSAMRHQFGGHKE